MPRVQGQLGQAFRGVHAGEEEHKPASTEDVFHWGVELFLVTFNGKGTVAYDNVVP